MRTTLIIFLCPIICFSQISISDDFSDGDFTHNPIWDGDTGSFNVNTAFELQLDDSVAGSAYLSTVSEISENASWEFSLKMDFNPSSSNFAKVYLTSNTSDLNGSINGYYLRLGGSSSDRISLYRQDGSSSTMLVESTDDWVDLSQVEVSVKVTRDSLGFWVLYADTSGTSGYVAIDSVSDTTYSTSQYFGIECIYTITRSDKFYFDNFSLSGFAYNDNQAAKVVDLAILDSSKIRLKFSEPMDSSSAMDIANYQVDGIIGLPVSAVLNQQNSTEVDLTFGSVFQINTAYYLYVNSVEDLYGNTTHDTLDILRFQAEENQIIITELMPDPSPIVGIPPNALPEREYVELYNNSPLSIDLLDWVLRLGSTDEVLPSYVLDSGEYVVIAKDIGASEFPSGTPVLGVDMSSTALTNGGTTVSLISPKGVAVNSVSYTDDWYDDENKKTGGWSLELIDIENACAGKENWRASANSIGGTPGVLNSVSGVNPDTTSPSIIRVAILGDSAIGIYFSEEVDQQLLSKASNYEISPELVIESVEPDIFGHFGAKLRFAQKIEQEVLYHLKFNELLSDCAGNFMKNDSVVFTIPAIPEVGEVIINEVLFNPYSQGSDFVELYNYSDRVFDLNKLLLGNWNETTQMLENAEPISNVSYLFGPGEYVAISSDIDFLRENYEVENQKALLKSDGVPSMPDSEGSVAIVTSSLATVCDYFEYNANMHLSVLENDEGVSLERISFAKSTQDDDNWHSTASSAGYATPGYQNSMAYTQVSTGNISVEPKVFSPNQDGYHDILKVNYSFANGGNVVSLSIWNSSGILIKDLQENTTVGQEGFFTWDGTDANGQLKNSGVYIVVFEYFNANGSAGVFKETCVLSL